MKEAPLKFERGFILDSPLTPYGKLLPLTRPKITPADAFSSESIVVFKVTWNWVSSLVKVRDIHTKVPNNTRNTSTETLRANLNELPWSFSMLVITHC